MKPRDRRVGVMALSLYLIAALCASQVSGFHDFLDYGRPTEDQLNLLQFSSTYCPAGQIFVFARNKCVMQDGTRVPGEEPICKADDQDVCYVDDKFICTGKDDCSHVDVKFALMEHRSLSDFISDYNRQRSMVESALEAAVGATPSQIYALKLHHRDGIVFVTARADSSLQPMLEQRFEERHQFMQNSYGKTIGINWDMSYPPETVDPLKTECGPGQQFCFLTGRCISDAVTMDTPCSAMYNDIPSEHCHEGQTFCLLTGRCVDDAVTMDTPCSQREDDVYVHSEQCHKGQRFCFLTGRCVDDDVTMETPCRRPIDDDGPSEHCHPGQRFCFLTGRCVDDDVTMDTPCKPTIDDDGPSEHCHPGQRFCFLTGRCVDDSVTMDTNCKEIEQDVPSVHCHKGQRFCLLTGRCVDDAVTMDTPCGDDDDDGHVGICHSGQRFCVVLGRCVDDTVDCREREDDRPTEHCLKGQRFCFLTGRCVDDIVTMDTPCGEIVDPVPTEHCHKGQTFCFLTGRCIDDKVDMDGTCQCSSGKVKCYSEDTKMCKWGHECQYKQAIVTADGDFSTVEHHTDELVAINTGVLKAEAGLRQMEYMFAYSGSIGFALRTSDIRILSELPRLIQERKFPLDLNGNPMNVLEYRVWDEWTYEGEHKVSFDGAWMDYSYPTYCHKGQTMCFLTGKCIDDMYRTDSTECHVPAVPSEPKVEVPSEDCYAGQTFCFLTGKCIDGMHRTDSAECPAPTVPSEPKVEVPTEDCYAGQTFCFLTGKCIDDMYRTDSAECPAPTGPSEPKVEVPTEDCHAGQTFCLWSGKCVEDHCDSSCPEGQVVCEARNNECVDEAECPSTTDNVDGNDDTPMEHCTKEQTFCFHTGKCIDQTEKPCDKTCPVDQVLCVSQNNECVNTADCQTYIVSVTFAEDFDTVVGDDVDAYNAFLLVFLSQWLPKGSVIDISTTSGSIISRVKTTVPVDDITAMIKEMEADTDTPIEYNGHALTKPDVVLVEEEKECLIPEMPVWCEVSKTCVAQGQCDVVTEKDVFIIWATLSDDRSFSDMVAPDEAIPLEEQFIAFKERTKSSLQTLVETTGLIVTGVSVIPANRDGSKVEMVAVAEATSGTMTVTDLQAALADASIGSNMQIDDVNVWKSLGTSAPVQIFPSTEPLIYNKDVSLDVSFLPDEISSLLTTLTLDCTAEDGITIKINDKYVQRADFASNKMTFKVTTETTKFAKCEILNIPADIKGSSTYYIGFIVLSGDVLELSKISDITAGDLTLDEDSECQYFPEDLFTLGYKGDPMLGLFLDPKWPEKMTDAQESWVDPIRTVQVVERLLLQYIQGVQRRQSSLRVSVALHDGSDAIFNNQKVIKFRYMRTNLEKIEGIPQVLTSPEYFQYCLAPDFSGTLQLGVTHRPSAADTAVTAAINIQVNPSNDRPEYRNGVKDIISEFSYPKVSDTNPGREFQVQDLAAIWYTDIDMETDENAQLGLGVIGAVVQSDTVAGQWEYTSGPGTTWQTIPEVPDDVDDTSEISVPVLLLKHDWKLRFKPEAESLTDTWEIARSPSLVLFAWDQSNIASLPDLLTDVPETTVVIEECRTSMEETLDVYCVKGDAYSSAIRWVILPREGCDGVPGSGMVATRCGCGKTPDSCVDCNKDVNGEAEVDKCGICSGGQTGKTANTQVDCEDATCRSNNVQYCERKEEAIASISSACPEAQRLNECYNRTSTIYHNKCTSEATAPVDACNIKCGYNECLDCDGTPNGGKLLNPCGQCKELAVLNEGCEGLGDIFPLLSFTHATLNMSVRISDGIVESLNTPISCQLIPQNPTVEGQVTPAVSNIKYVAGTITFTTKVSVENKAKSAGLYAVECNVGNTVLSTADTEQFHQRFTNPTLSTIVPDVLTSGAEMVVTISGTGFHDTGEIYCIIPYDNGVYLSAFATRVNDKEVTCDLGKFKSKLRGTSYTINVILNKLKTMVQELTSLNDPLSFAVKLPAPSLVSAKFNPNNCLRIDIKFNVRISGTSAAGDGGCSSYFDEASMAILQADAKCKLSGGRLVVITTVTVPVNTVLTLVDIKQELESSTSPNIFSGIVTITQDTDMVPPKVYIDPRIPNTIGCKKQRVRVIIKQKQCWNAEITWTASVEDSSESSVQDKINELNAFLAGKQTFNLEKSQLADVPVILTASWTLTEGRTGDVITASESIVVQKDDSVALAILGVDKIVEAEQILIPRGEIKGCLTDTNTDIIPSWTLKPEGIYNKFKKKLRAVIDKGALPSNTEMNLTLTVTIGEKVLSKSVIFTTTAIPPEAVIEYKGATASEREDAIYGEGLQLTCKNEAEDSNSKFLWTGMTNRYDSTMGPMIDQSGSSSERLEIPTPELSLPWDQIKGDELILAMTCRVDQGELSSEATTMLVYKEASSIDTPFIRTRYKSGELIRIYEGDEAVKIRTYCQFTTRFEWYSDIATEEEMLLSGVKAGTIENENNDERFRYCGVTIDLTGLELSPDLYYPLTLMAVNARNGQEAIEYLYFTFVYVTKPIGGTVEAIYEGATISAYTTPVSFVLDNWANSGGDDLDLKCKIYYSKVDSTRKRRLTPVYISVEDIVEDVTFPAGEFTVEATCCNPLNVRRLCTTVTMDTTLVSVKQADLTSFKSILDDMELKLKTGFSTFIAALIDVMVNNDLNVDEKKQSDAIALTGIAEELNVVKEVGNSDTEAAIEALSNIKEIADTSVAMDATTKSDLRDVVKATARTLTGQVLSGRRRKRDTTTTSTATGMSVSEAETLLGTFDNLITGDPVGKETAEAFKEVIDLALLGLCQAYTGSTSWVAGSVYTTVQATQMTLTGQAATEYDVSCGSCLTVTYPAKVVYGADIVSQYGGSDICVSSGQILVDTVTPTGTAIDPTRMSDLVVLKLFNLDGFTTETVTGLSSQSVKVTLTLTNSTINSTAYDYVCKMWASTGTWSDTECTASEPVLDGSTSKYSVECSCNALGTLGVFRELKNESSTTTSTSTSTTASTTTVTVTTTTAAPSVSVATTTTHVTVGWTFSNTFGTDVLDVTTFKSNLKSQLSSQLGIPSASCKNMEVKSGSILVSFDLYAYSSSGQTLGQMLYSLQNGISSVTLTNTNGNTLVVQAGTFYYQEVGANSGDSDKGNGNLGLIIGATIGGLVIVGIVVVAVVFIVKKYSQPKTHPLRNNSSGSQGYDAPPAYDGPAYEGVPAPPSYLYDTPIAPEPLKPYPVSNKWIENELAKGQKPTDSGSRPRSRDSVQRLISPNNSSRNQPTPVG